MGILRLALLGSLATATPLLPVGGAATGHAASGQRLGDRAALSMTLTSIAPDVGRRDACADAERQTPSSTMIRLQLVNRAGLPDDTRRELMQESARIWRKSGVTVLWSDDPKANAGDVAADTASESDRPAPADLYVTIASELPEPRATSQYRPLAEILFVGGVPTTLITAFPREAERLMEDAHANDRPLTERPADVRREVLGRVLGRAIAHELGHYLFKTSEHVVTGLMRARLRIDELISEFDWPFRVVAPRVAGCGGDASRW